MSKHTPGPWVARPVPNVGVRGHTGYAIDFNQDQEQVVDFVYEEADARLIAAAPDLLEALEEIKRRICYIRSFSAQEAEAIIDKAISRAKGEAK